MRLFKQGQSSGYTLIELLLALLIIISIALIGITQYRHLRAERDIQAVKQNVTAVFHALNVYYRINCTAEQQQGNQFTVDREKLVQAGLWPNLIRSNLVDSDSYRVGTRLVGKTKDTEQNIYQLYVTLQPNVETKEALEFYRNILGATREFVDPANNAFGLEWEKLPSYSVPQVDPGLWGLDMGLRQFKKEKTLKIENVCAY